MIRLPLTLCLALSMSACVDQASGGGAGSRDYVTVVGSSTIYPFTAIVAEQFVNSGPGIKAPVIESTGTGSGMKLFCAGIGASHPDIEAASRRMKASEYAVCAKNGVTDILEIEVGLDGVAFAEAKNGPKMALTPADLYRALAAAPDGRKNTTKTWRDVNPALPATPIQIYGPPSTSGTRDALTELILDKGCEAVVPRAAAMRETDKDGFAALCNRIREDGAYIDAGENDNLIVQKLQSNPNAIGIFGYSYLEENRDNVDGVPLNDVAPSYATIASGAYPGSRPLYIYVKKAHLKAIPGLAKFLNAYVAAWEPNGPLTAKGLIAAPPEARTAAARVVALHTILNPADLH